MNKLAVVSLVFTALLGLAQSRAEEVPQCGPELYQAFNGYTFLFAICLQFEKFTNFDYRTVVPTSSFRDIELWANRRCKARRSPYALHDHYMATFVQLQATGAADMMINIWPKVSTSGFTHAQIFDGFVHDEWKKTTHEEQCAPYLLPDNQVYWEKFSAGKSLTSEECAESAITPYYWHRRAQKKGIIVIDRLPKDIAGLGSYIFVSAEGFDPMSKGDLTYYFGKEHNLEYDCKMLTVDKGMSAPFMKVVRNDVIKTLERQWETLNKNFKEFTPLYGLPEPEPSTTTTTSSSTTTTPTSTTTTSTSTTTEPTSTTTTTMPTLKPFPSHETSPKSTPPSSTSTLESTSEMTSESSEGYTTNSTLPPIIDPPADETDATEEFVQAADPKEEDFTTTTTTEQPKPKNNKLIFIIVLAVCAIGAIASGIVAILSHIGKICRPKKTNSA